MFAAAMLMTPVFLGYSADITAGLSIVASATVGGSAAAAIDDNAGTGWYGATTLGANERLTIDFTTAKTIRKMTFRYGDIGQGLSGPHWPNSWGVYHSDDGSTFTLAETVTGLAQDTTVQTKLIGDAGLHRYWRIQNADAGRYPSIAELEMMEGSFA